MKLLRCNICRDVRSLTLRMRHCACKRSKGRYLRDGLHAEYWGPATIWGMLNHEVRFAERHPPTKPYTQDFKWFVIGHWDGCHIIKRDAE
jgi:hypothetical protein